MSNTGGYSEGYLTEWYTNLETVKNHLITHDPKLREVFTTVDASGFKLHTMIKDPYTALLGAIIGQKISYITAKSLRGQLYSRFPNITPAQIRTADLNFLGTAPATIIYQVTNHIITNNVDLNTEEGIRSLTVVPGIGPWTIQTTLLSCLKNWDIFPEGDKFLHKRLQRLYGNNYDIANIIMRWTPHKSVVTWYLWRWF